MEQSIRYHISNTKWSVFLQQTTRIVSTLKTYSFTLGISIFMKLDFTHLSLSVLTCTSFYLKNYEQKLHNILPERKLHRKFQFNHYLNLQFTHYDHTKFPQTCMRSKLSSNKFFGSY